MSDFVKLLNRTDWETARPPQWAEWIPGLLTELYFNTEEHIDRDTIESLRTYIAHNSGIYETTIKTIPILMYLLTDKELTKKRWVLELLFTIRFSANLNLPLYQKTYNLMYNGFSQIATYIDSDDVHERWFTANILSHFILHQDEAVNILISRLKIENETECIVAILDAIRRLYINDDGVIIFTRVKNAIDDDKISKSSFPCIMAYSTLIALQKDIPLEIGHEVKNCIRKNINELMEIDAMKLAEVTYDMVESIRNVNNKTKQIFLEELLTLRLPEVMERMLQQEFDKCLKFE